MFLQTLHTTNNKITIKCLFDTGLHSLNCDGMHVHVSKNARWQYIQLTKSTTITQEMHGRN